MANQFKSNFHARVFVVGFVFLFTFCVGSQYAKSADILDASLSRHGNQLKLAFQDVVKEAVHLIVEVEVNGTTVAPGTLIDADRGILVAKASDLGEYISEADRFRCHLHNGKWKAARYLGYENALDLVFLEIKRADNLDIQKIESSSELKAGQWLISIEYGEKLPLGIGVLGALPREIATASGSGYVGLTVDQGQTGLTIKDVFANSSAARAGLKSGDVILNDNNKPLKKRRILSRLFSSYEPGDWFLLKALRNGELMTFDIRVGTSWDNLIDRQAMMNRFGSDVSERRSGFRSVLQHDTLMHPDRCGGPLIDIDGKLVGVNIARAGRTDTLAVPIKEIETSLKEIVESSSAD